MDLIEKTKHAYLGDGVYVEKIEDGFILRTGHHEDNQCDNRIVIDYMVFENLNSFLKKMKVAEHDDVERKYLGILFLQPELIKKTCLCMADFKNQIHQEIFTYYVSRETSDLNHELYGTEMAAHISASMGIEYQFVLDYINKMIDECVSLRNFKSYEDIIRERSVHNLLVEVLNEQL